MNPLIFVILIIMILFTVYHFWTDIRNYLNTGETFAEGMTNIGKVVKYEMLTDISDFCADGTNKTTKMEWTGEVCDGGKIKWNSMKSLAGTTRADQPNGCSWNRDENYATDTWKTKYLGSCGVSPTRVSLPTTVDDLQSKGGKIIDGESGNNLVLNSPVSGNFSAGTQVQTDGSTGNTVTTTDAQGNTITTTTTESSSVDPTTGAKIEKKCISVSELASASAWVDHLFGTLGDTKCADKSKIDAAKTASKMDFISGVIKGYQNERDESNEYYMSAISKAKPYLDQAFSGNGVSGDENNLAQATDQTVSTNTQQTEAPVVNDIQAPQPPVWQAEAMAQNFSNEQQQAAQQPTQQVINNQVLPNGFIVQPGSGKCPNGCKFPQYDNDKCTDTIVNGKGYRKCPWVKDGMNSGDCAECGAILMPKNEYGYARTRPGLFDSVSIGLAADNSKTDNKSDYYNIGKNFMNQLSNIKNFKLPNNIETDEYVSIGKMVHKFQTEKSDSSKKMLTDFINQILTTGLDSADGKVNRNSMVTVELNNSGGNFDLDIRKLSMKGAYAYDEGKKEVSSDNRLGGSSTMYEKNLSERVRRRNGIPRDPRKRPQPYDSIWDIFKY